MHDTARIRNIALSFAALLGGTLLSFGSAWANAAVPSAEQCKARANDTSPKLLECMQRDALWRHLKNFQKIADQNPDKDGHGNRDTGTPGYRASVNYVAKLMQQAGYQVTVQKYVGKHFDLLAPPQFTTDLKAPALGKDWFVARLSGNGSANAVVQPVGSGEGGASESGCERAEFSGFKNGNIALLKRGACDPDRQVANATASGAAAVIFYNADADAEKTGGKARADGRAFQILLDDVAAIPVIGAIGYARGAELAARYRSGQAPRAIISVQADHRSDIDYNVIANSFYGDSKKTVVVEGHLDSIYGAGILDNASGSATILELALNMAHTKTRNRLRYMWFGGEEIGLLGSKYYTQNLSKAERRKIAFDVDVDVTATPNFDVLIADPGHASGADKFPPNVIPQSEVGNRAFLDYFASVGITARKARFGNDGTDSIAFSRIGIPDSGILTQQDCCKQAWEVRLWGGYLGDYEGQVPGRGGACVDKPHRWCDNLSNNDPFVLEFASKGVASAVLTLANHPFK